MSTKKLFAIGFSLILLIMSIWVTRAQDSGCDPEVNTSAQGDGLFAEGNYAGAVSAYTCALQTRPDSAALYNARGNAYRHLENYAQAIVDYNRAVELAPSVAMFYNNRGFAEYKQGSLTPALNDLNHAIQLDSTLAYAFNNRGLIYAQQGQNELAAADFHKAIDLGHDPISWPTLNLSNLHMDTSADGVPPVEATVPPPVVAASDDLAQGQKAYRAEDYEGAIAAFSRAIEANPNDAYLFCERAAAYYMSGDYQRAVEDYTSAINLGHQAFHYTWRGNSYVHLGQNDKALEDYTAAIRVEPTYFNAYLFRALLYHQMGETDLSRDDLAQWAKGNFSQFVSQPTPESGETVSLNLANDQIYAFKVPVKKGQILTIETITAPDSTVDPMLVLVESGIPQAADDDGGAGINAAIKQFVVPGDCVYDLYLMHPGTVGPLNLTITITNP
ncbi:MAG: tetratricopeptide repeat protein [Chloroflexota bacterium]